VAGVCSGLAAGLHVEVMWVRLAFVLLALLQGIGVLLYVVLWVVMPGPVDSRSTFWSGFDSLIADLKRAWTEVRGWFGSTKPMSPTGHPPADAPPGQATAQTAPAATPGQSAAARNQSLLFGLVLVSIGLVILANNLGFVQWDLVWPAVLIAFGVLLLARSVVRKQ
jgi:phage shock protein PspC (stress-responsive transcriptional regulator)